MEGIKFVVDFDIDDISIEELQKCFSQKHIYKKSEILLYMKSAPMVACTTAPTVDRLTGRQVNAADNARSDGVYQWYESEIYYFERYNLKLSNEFIEHVLIPQSS